MSRLKVFAWISGGLALAAVVFAATFVSYFIAAMQRPPESPFSIACTQLAARHGSDALVRFDIANASRKDATWMNFALFATNAEGRNLTDSSYVLQTRVPANGNISKVVAVPLPSNYRTRRFAGLRCNIINAVFADGSQQSYGGNTGTFP